ncbi:cholinesterase [Elsinoe ampelina]|uniref:Carboxylic ester hydrolase n=1 Tax=Elsinoe ampelina TaxID=302913 RepID=A0A6A6GFY9_9PEZI|nr:cholinesterase [Elsinoe ampelina]
MKTQQILSLLVAISSSLAAPYRGRLQPRQAPSGAPVVTLQNGSYYGVEQTNYSQDLFLGIPFAEPPIDELRFANPQSLNQTWEGQWPATNYAFECIGYGGDQIGYQQSEDCLYLNVVRPSGYENQSLPVAVWIHGGGFYMGGAVDRRYNLSFIVENSVKIGKPIIAASIPYRLGPFGFLQSSEVQAAGQTNLGLKDQRLALQWIQENIGAFGGDPDKVTIFGESAGGASVGFHITAFNGRDDGLFRAAILESGNPVSYQPLNGVDFYQPIYDNLTKAAGCGNCSDTLACLRDVPLFVLNNILNTTEFNSGWNPTIDGDFVARPGSEQLADGSFVKVPIIDGANSDEGTAFSPRGIDTEADFVAVLQANSSSAGRPGQQGLSPEVIQQILDAYPADPDAGIPSSESLGGNVTIPLPFGVQWRRSAAFAGDQTFIAGRRLTCQTWAAAGVNAYCYRFNAIPAGIPWPIQATHFQEVAFVFNNLEGLGYAIPPFQNKSEAYTRLSDFMSNTWASFVYDLNPNNWTGRAEYGAEDWPKYTTHEPQDFVFDANRTSYAEPDTYRAEGIALINSLNPVFGR